VVDATIGPLGNSGAMDKEVILTIRGCHVEPCQLVIGVRRNMSELECRVG